MVCQHKKNKGQRTPPILSLLMAIAAFIIIMTNALVSVLLSASTKGISSSGGRRSIAPRLVAQAFTTTTTSSKTNAPTRGQRQRRHHHHHHHHHAPSALLFGIHHNRLQQRCLSSVADAIITRTSSTITASSTRLLSTTSEVEEDLDAALDDILGGALSEAENPPVVAVDGGKLPAGGHMEGSRSIPKNLIEVESEIDYQDPKFLSTSNKYWTSHGLSQKVIDVLSHKGITQFTPVQAEAFEPIMKRRDIIGRSRTGTGKTLAFGLPGLTKLVDYTIAKGTRDAQTGRMMRGRLPSMLVLCPTRELARQVSEELSQVAQPLNLFVNVFHGGVSYDPQARALRNGIDVIVGTPGRIIDHIERGNLDLSEVDIVVLDEADEMLNMGFAEDVEVILEGLGSANEEKSQSLLFSATTPPWVKEIGRQYQTDVLHIDSTSEEGGARVANTVRHLAVQLPPGVDSKKFILEDIIAVEISRDAEGIDDDNDEADDDDNDDDVDVNHIAAAAADRKKKSTHAMQQKIFGKTIVFTETKREADELVSGGVFKSLTAQALHGDVGQKQRDATLKAFRQGAFNVLVATDVAARGIDIQDVDLVVQFDPPRDPDTYVHRSGRTGRAGKKGVSVLLFNPQQARDIVKIERDLGHGFKFDLVGPPSTEAALKAAARTSAIASKTIPEETADYFKDAAEALLFEEGASPTEVVARCLAAISRRSAEVQSRSLITGELAMATIEMKNERGRSITPSDVMFTVGKLARMSRRSADSSSLSFDSDVGKIQANSETGAAIFDMGVEDAKRLVDFSADIDAGGAVFSLLKEMEIERGRHFGKTFDRNRRGGGGGGRFNNRYGNNRGRGGGGWNERSSGGRSGRGGDRPSYNHHGQNRRANHEGRQQRTNDSRGGYRGRYDSGRRSSNNYRGDSGGGGRRGGGGGGGGGGGYSGW